MYVQRFATQDERGEEATLTLRMTLEERLAPNYKSATVFEQWVVHSVTGEPAEDAHLPSEPHARVAPEAVVAAQLDALKWGDSERCRRFASPRNVASSVDASVFREMLDTPAYAPLSDPEGTCEVSRCVQLGSDSFAAVVTCRSWNHGGGRATYTSWNVKGKGAPPPRYFVWLLTRQPGSGSASATDLAAAAALGGERVARAVQVPQRGRLRLLADGRGDAGAAPGSQKVWRLTTPSSRSTRRRERRVQSACSVDV